MARPKGQPKLGGRQKGTPNKLTSDIKAIAREMTPAATARLALLLQSDNDSVALGAVKEVYDRAFGKATTVVGNEEGEAFKVVHELILRGVQPHN